MSEYKYINFEEAVNLNKTNPVGFLFENGEDIDETWFPTNFLWSKKLGKLPLMNYTIANLKHGVWVYE